MWPNSKRRSTQSEMMDDPTIDFVCFSDCLRDLAIVNRLSLGYRPTLAWFKRQLRKRESIQHLSIFDVGSGGGDMLRQIARMVQRPGHSVSLTGIDLNPWSKRYAEQVTSPDLGIQFETSDIFNFAPDRKADFVISSLFTHHLNDDQLVDFLRWMEHHTTQGWFINDLHRHPLAYFLIKYGALLLGFHIMVRHDGPISVARAFTKTDWIGYLKAAAIPMDQVKIRWFFPFRYGVERHK